MTFILQNGPEDAAARLIIAHGAGAGITNSFLETIAVLLAEQRMAVTRFEFEYMSARRTGGVRKPPPRAEALMSEYRDFVTGVIARKPKGQRLFIGGKSLGGRVASMIADDLHRSGLIDGLVCLGYPFHPPSKPEALRTAHLIKLECPALIVQGERDPFGDRTEVASMNLSKQIELHWIGDGDHDLTPRRASGRTKQGNLTEAADAVAAFVSDHRRAR
jgi:predicted alpha/beta-hydrolase family hydrolase